MDALIERTLRSCSPVVVLSLCMCEEGRGAVQNRQKFRPKAVLSQYGVVRAPRTRNDVSACLRVS